MRLHHTKNKGDLGILYAQLDLAKKGYGILSPLTEHEAFDLVAYKDHRFYRVQVKYRAAVDGVVEVVFRSIWVDRHRVHYVPIDKQAVDLVVVFCPNTERCYYLDPTTFGARARLRLTPTRSGRKKGVTWAADFESMPETIRGVAVAARGAATADPALERNPDVRQSPGRTTRP